MIRSRLFGFLGFLLLLFQSLHAAPAGRLLVDENRIRIDIGDTAILSLPVTNTSSEPISTTLQLEVLSPDNSVQHELSLPASFGRGTTVLSADVSGILKLKDASKSHYGWLRLKYSLRGDTGGIVSISKIAPEPFVMDVSTPDLMLSSQYRFQILVQEPVRGRPMQGVELSTTLISEDTESTVATKSARTSASGYVQFIFDLPKGPSESEYRLEVTGKFRRFERSVVRTFQSRNKLAAIASTDKPVYQPGQKLHMRALVFDLMRNASRGSSLNVSIWDPGDDKVFETSLSTSAFGEAHTDWEIPDNARLGTYEIRVEPEDGFESREFVWVGRYDLPNFAIDVRQRYPYYLPGQTPEVDITAEYLFGKPVPQAKVRVVREIHRSWNYREMKWEVDEGEVIEGVTDRDGRFHAALLVDTDFDELTESRTFRDLTYGVYVTDPSTGRTEQRRFWPRITSHPIHLYITGLPQTRDLPLEFYITASYADGTPAVCDIAILEKRDGSNIPIGNVRTNRYGVAKASGLKPSLDFGENGWPTLELRARDAADRTGLATYYNFHDDDALRLYTDKPLYRASEPIRVHIESSILEGHIVLNASSGGQILYSTVLHPSDGKADTVIPGSKSFRGGVTISAFHIGDLTRSAFDGRQVLFPSIGDLEIEANSTKRTYVPGEEATLTFRVRNTNGSSQASLLGVSIFDKAVEDRARTDAEFSEGYVFCRGCVFSSDRRLPGITRADLDRVNRKQPIPPDLSLAAEVLLLDGSWYADRPDNLGDVDTAGLVFTGTRLQRRLDALKGSDSYPSGFYLPSDDASLREIVGKIEPEFDMLRDPWGNGYHLVSTVSQDQNRIKIVSSGADEVFPSIDDFTVAWITWPYFAECGKHIRAAATQYHERTGRYIRDIQTLKEELRRQGHDYDAWRDPNGRQFTTEFLVEGNRFHTVIHGADSIVWTESVDYTADLQPRVDAALNRLLLRQDALPQNHSDVVAVLAASGILENDLRDPWGHVYYTIFKIESGYFDSVTLTSAGAVDKVQITPLTRQTEFIRFRSAGPDGIGGTQDDFTALSFMRPFKEQSSEEATPRFVESPLLDPAHGAIYGAVIDRTGALIPGVSVKVTAPTGREFELITAEAGDFALRNLEPGTYRVRIALPGFVTKSLTGVLVRGGVATKIVAALEIASISSNVEVSVASPMVFATQGASVGEVIQTDSRFAQPISTPRLREYFPETLLWQPALETGTNGRAQVRFKLADSLTTWKAVAIASTKDGRIAVAEKEIVAFQPFFVEHDPPKFLTDGDQIALPVVARNYLDRDQSLDLSMKSEGWFTPLNNASRHVEVRTGEFVREVFAFKAVKPILEGRQRIIAQGPTASDAIEKTSTVYPLGREMTQVSGSVFRGVSNHTVTIPPDAFVGTVRAELKIYPNLMAHVVDAIEGIMQRPHGCAEQVISSAYPSLLYLRYAKQARLKSDPASQKARRYLGVALQTLRGYQSDEGGFSYWTRGQADAAVTAYGIQFLKGAKEFIAFDDEITDDARQWLLKRQEKDGSWQSDPKLTAYIASTLSSGGPDEKVAESVGLALAYLRKLSFQPSEPYTTASIALAALQTGDRQLADAAISTLRSEVHYEGGAAFWDLQTNTPFYSWGRPGRLEATAVAVRAFAAAGSDAELVDKGLLFLLRNKDRYGVWYSTQATVRVLDVFARLLDSRQADSPGSATIVVNGVSVGTVSFGTRQQPDSPVTVDLSKFLKPGPNRVEVLEQKKTSTATVQLVESHYIPWNPSAPDLSAGPLRYSVRYSTKDAAISDAITVLVEAERIGFRGYGMMLAEVGLPPGAEVDRESLAAAVASSRWDLARYDVLPDRVIVYLWPRAGGTTFNFKFRPRYGLEAHTPASKLYDYYNPDAYSILLPEQFKIR